MEYKLWDDSNKVLNMDINTDGNTELIDTKSKECLELESFLNELTIMNKNKKDLNNATEDDMKKYMNNIGVQASYLLITAYNENDRFLSLFKEFSTNFPHYANTLPHIPKKSYKYLINYIQTIQNSLRQGNEQLTINGITFSVKKFDIYNFYQTILKESEYVDQLIDIFKIYDNEFSNYELINKLLSTIFTIGNVKKSQMGGMMGMFGGMGMESGLKEEDIRIDMRDKKYVTEYNDINSVSENDVIKKVIIWCNDIRKDKQYRKYYGDLRALKSFMAFQQIVPIRRNMYHSIVIFDPINIDEWTIFMNLNGMSTQLPLHQGFVLYPKKLFEKTGMFLYWKRDIFICIYDIFFEKYRNKR